MGGSPTWSAKSTRASRLPRRGLFGWLLRNRLFYGLAAVTAACWSLGRGGGLYVRLRRALPGLPYLIAASAAFVVALLISLVKARRARRSAKSHGGLAKESAWRNPRCWAGDASAFIPRSAVVYILLHYHLRKPWSTSATPDTPAA